MDRARGGVNREGAARAKPAPVVAVIAVVVALAVLLVGFSLSRPEPVTYLPSPVESAPEVQGLSGIRTVTVDASESDRWRYFSFRYGSVVEDPGPTDWDLAFRRFQIITNGDAGFPGRGGLLDLGEVDFEAVDSVPATGYQGTVVASDSINPAIQRWYDYSFFSHLLTPKPRVYAVRTADGRFARFQLLGYYCPGPTPGCLTFRYEYDGGGGRRFTP